MHRNCIGACRNACYCNPQRLCNNCLCCNTPTFPRNCISCIISNRHKDDEWKCYSRCLTGLYGKDITKHQTDTSLWRRAKRERDRYATSMIDLSKSISPQNGVAAAAYNTTSTATILRAAKNKKRNSKAFVRPAEIIIERLDAQQCGGPMGLATNRQATCTSHRMAQLLMETKLFEEKCKCNPYDSVPDVPLAFYPKLSCQDNYGNPCDDEYAKRLVELICNQSGRHLKVRNLVSKSFLKSLNELYAHVGGGKDGNSMNDNMYQKASWHSVMEQEFYGYFGETNRHQTFSRRSMGTMTDVNENNSRRSSRRISNSHTDKTFNYPTSYGTTKDRLMSLDTKAVKKYLALQAKKRRRVSKPKVKKST